MALSNKFMLKWKYFNRKRVALLIAAPCLLMIQMWIVPFEWMEGIVATLKNGAPLKPASYQYKIAGSHERMINNLDDVNFVFSDKLCFKSFEGLPDNEERNAWLRTAYKHVIYEEGLLNITNENASLQAKKNSWKDPRLRNIIPVTPSGPSLVAEYRAASSFANERLRFSAEDQDVVACSFPKFTREESHHIWRLAVRRRLLHDACARRKGFMPPKWNLADHLYWDLHSHLGYCPIAKVGSTSWQSHLLHWSGVNSNVLNDEEVHIFKDQVFPRPPPRRLASELEHHQPLLFMVHRHPFVRIVSAYTEKIKRGYISGSDRLVLLAPIRGKSLHEIVKDVKQSIKDKFPWRSGNHALDNLLSVHGDPYTSPDFEVLGDSQDKNPEMTFREFVRMVIRQILPCSNDLACLRFVDDHWHPQHARCAPCTAYYDVIAAINTFTEDTGLIMKLVGRSDHYMNATEQGSADQFKCSKNCSHSTSSPPKSKDRRRISLDDKHVEKTNEYMKQLTAEEKRLLFVTYFLDFSLFGYSPDTIE